MGPQSSPQMAPACSPVPSIAARLASPHCLGEATQCAGLCALWPGDDRPATGCLGETEYAGSRSGWLYSNKIPTKSWRNPSLGLFFGWRKIRPNKIGYHQNFQPMFLPPMFSTQQNTKAEIIIGGRNRNLGPEAGCPRSSLSWRSLQWGTNTSNADVMMCVCRTIIYLYIYMHHIYIHMYIYMCVCVSHIKMFIYIYGIYIWYMIYIYICICIYKIYKYIYIYHIHHIHHVHHLHNVYHIYICVSYISIYHIYIYMYIHMYREREIDKNIYVIYTYI